MKHETKEARTYLLMYESSKDDNHLKSALRCDYAYTVVYAMEKGFYWNIQTVINNINDEYSKAV